MKLECIVGLQKGLTIENIAFMLTKSDIHIKKVDITN